MFPDRMDSFGDGDKWRSECICQEKQWYRVQLNSIGPASIRGRVVNGMSVLVILELKISIFWSVSKSNEVQLWYLLHLSSGLYFVARWWQWFSGRWWGCGPGVGMVWTHLWYEALQNPLTFHVKIIELLWIGQNECINNHATDNGRFPNHLSHVSCQKSRTIACHSNNIKMKYFPRITDYFLIPVNPGICKRLKGKCQTNG